LHIVKSYLKNKTVTNMNPTHPLKNLALSFSGGGYRASAYNLGVLSYLNHIQFDNAPLLKQVAMISTISGGTITGVKYALSLAQGKSFDDFFDELYAFLQKDIIMDEAFKTLNARDNWQYKSKSKNLINAFAEIYQKQLLDNTSFGLLLDYTAKTGVEFMFNATDLENSKPFRFQTSPKGLIGNREHHIAPDHARNFRLGDIVAASSCFPGGFEPMNFPHDFLENQPQVYNSEWETKTLRIMDGGIVDNQGMESIWLAESRKDNAGSRFVGTYIVSDVALKEVEMLAEEAVASKGISYQLGRLSTQHYNGIFMFVSLISIGIILLTDHKWLVALASVCLTINLIFIAIYFKIKSLLRKTLKTTLSQKMPKFLSDSRIVGKISLNRLFELLEVRIGSILELNNTVFLARIRQLHYSATYDDMNWSFRTFSNLIYELPKHEANENILSPALKERVKKANLMDTTLWFSDEEKQDNRMLHDLVICGQATFCFKLKMYLDKRLKDTENELPKEWIDNVTAVFNAASADYEKFKTDPEWLLKGRIAELVKTI
jgi:predicted acylesterase/phospholipase RssA